MAGLKALRCPFAPSPPSLALPPSTERCRHDALVSKAIGECTTAELDDTYVMLRGRAVACSYAFILLLGAAIEARSSWGV